MWYAVIGLILCLTSFLILTTINPKIPTLTTEKPVTVQESGVYYSNGNAADDTCSFFV